jgi:ADP-ribose pyrophosphatase YjhB (NUDIX family)
MAGTPQFSPAFTEVYVLVTRDGKAGLEVLVEDGARGLTVPHGAVREGEHATEAALRVATTATGYDVYFTFRRLAAAADAPRAAIYQTTPEIELPDQFERDAKIVGPARFRWLAEADARARLATALAPAFARLAASHAGEA